jgi:hypothetical protein
MKLIGVQRIPKRSQECCQAVTAGCGAAESTRRLLATLLVFLACLLFLHAQLLQDRFQRADLLAQRLKIGVRDEVARQLPRDPFRTRPLVVRMRCCSGLLEALIL